MLRKIELFLYFLTPLNAKMANYYKMAIDDILKRGTPYKDLNKVVNGIGKIYYTVENNTIIARETDTNKEYIVSKENVELSREIYEILH